MKIFLYFVGKTKDRHSHALTEDYLGRVSHFATIQSNEIRPDKFDLFGKHAAARKIFLDPTGKVMDSVSFADLIARAEMLSQELVFLVGGADGLPPEWRERADLLLSLSSMTFPHELAKAMLAEQIYRAFAILRGHPYPR